MLSPLPVFSPRIGHVAWVQLSFFCRDILLPRLILASFFRYRAAGFGQLDQNQHQTALSEFCITPCRIKPALERTGGRASLRMYLGKNRKSPTSVSFISLLCYSGSLFASFYASSELSNNVTGRAVEFFVATAGLRVLVVIGKRHEPFY